MRVKADSIAEYINAMPKEAQGKLKEIRALLKKAAPGSTEAIKWGEIGVGPNRKAGAALLRGGVAEFASRRISVTTDRQLI